VLLVLDLELLLFNVDLNMFSLDLDTGVIRSGYVIGYRCYPRYEIEIREVWRELGLVI
jgi:hypothetical protein